MNFEQLNRASNPLIKEENNNQQLNENLSADEYQQIHNQDNTSAQQSQESAKGETEQKSSNSEIPNEDLSQQNNSSNIQLSSKNNDRKINFLYFIGVNSLIMNVLISRTFKIFNCVLFQVSLILLSNLITYIALYKSQETKNLFQKISQKSISGYRRARKETTKKRLLISLGIILAVALISMTIVSFIKIQKLNKRINDYDLTIQNLRLENNRANCIYQQNNFQNNQQEILRINKIYSNLERQQQEISQNFLHNMKYLEEKALSQSREIEQLKSQLSQVKQQQYQQQNNQKIFEYQQQQQKQQQQQQQQQQNQQQQNQQNQNINEGKPDYPKIKHPLRDEVHSFQNPHKKQKLFDDMFILNM